MAEPTGIFMPNAVLEMCDLSASEKILLSVILALSGDAGCFASQEYLAKRVGLTRRGLQKALQNLIDSGRVVKDEGGQGKRGVLRVNLRTECASQPANSIRKSTCEQSEQVAPTCEQTSQDDMRTEFPNMRTPFVEPANSVPKTCELCSPIDKRENKDREEIENTDVLPGLEIEPSTKSPTTAPDSPRLFTSKAPRSAIAWEALSGWQGITEDDHARWADAYPAVNLKSQLARMDEWLRSNPRKAKKLNWRLFITNWLGRSQDRGGDIPSNQSPRYNQATATARMASAEEDPDNDWATLARKRKQTA